MTLINPGLRTLINDIPHGKPSGCACMAFADTHQRGCLVQCHMIRK